MDSVIPLSVKLIFLPIWLYQLSIYDILWKHPQKSELLETLNYQYIAITLNCKGTDSNYPKNNVKIYGSCSYSNFPLKPIYDSNMVSEYGIGVWYQSMVASNV